MRACVYMHACLYLRERACVCVRMHVQKCSILFVSVHAKFVCVCVVFCEHVHARTCAFQCAHGVCAVACMVLRCLHVHGSSWKGHRG